MGKPADVSWDTYAAAPTQVKQAVGPVRTAGTSPGQVRARSAQAAPRR